jgi:hypothetical protein
MLQNDAAPSMRAALSTPHDELIGPQDSAGAVSLRSESPSIHARVGKPAAIAPTASGRRSSRSWSCVGGQLRPGWREGTATVGVPRKTVTVDDAVTLIRGVRIAKPTGVRHGLISGAAGQVHRGTRDVTAGREHHPCDGTGRRRCCTVSREPTQAQNSAGWRDGGTLTVWSTCGRPHPAVDDPVGSLKM